MPKSSRKGVIITLLILVALAVIVRIYSAPLYDLLLRLHGRGGGQH